MNFIERWFGFSPDGGDGSTELLYILVPASVMLALFVGRRHLAKFVWRRAPPVVSLQDIESLRIGDTR
jgi:hypothetical protein